MDFSIEEENEDIASAINVTSLVDVVFLLLIFFMVTTTFADPSGIAVKLPKTTSAPTTVNSKDTLAVTIDQTGNASFNGTKTTIEELRGKLEQVRATKSGELTLVVRADKDTFHGTVVSVLDVAKRVGIDRISIATSPAAESK